jgi:hypothetical protein
VAPQEGGVERIGGRASARVGAGGGPAAGQTAKATRGGLSLSRHGYSLQLKWQGVQHVQPDLDNSCVFGERGYLVKTFILSKDFLPKKKNRSNLTLNLFRKRRLSPAAVAVKRNLFALLSAEADVDQKK